MEIKNFTRVHGDPSVLAEFSVYMPEWKCTLNNFRVRLSKKGSWFIAYPQTAKQLSDGKWDSKRTIVPDGELLKHFEDAVYHYVKELMAIEGLGK
jgi:hypothetical protein